MQRSVLLNLTFHKLGKEEFESSLEDISKLWNKITYSFKNLLTTVVIVVDILRKSKSYFFLNLNKFFSTGTYSLFVLIILRFLIIRQLLTCQNLLQGTLPQKGCSHLSFFFLSSVMFCCRNLRIFIEQPFFNFTGIVE